MRGKVRGKYGNGIRFIISIIDINGNGHRINGGYWHEYENSI